ncbi:MAG: hypothetical protein WAK82_18195 [Streptosporangiaceae bacterium]
MSGRLEEQLGPDEVVGSPPFTASELLHGAHRAVLEYRARREAFVEAVLAASPSPPSGLLAARAHASIWAGLAAAGQEVGAHDRLSAAIAITAGWRVGTANIRHVDRIAGLDIVTVTFNGSQRVHWRSAQDR